VQLPFAESHHTCSDDVIRRQDDVAPASMLANLTVCCLCRFETALQAHDPMVSLPYWDSTLDQTLPNPADSAIWTASYLGNNDGTVRSGPFAFWGVIPSCQNICGTLKRNTLVGNCCPWPRG